MYERKPASAYRIAHDVQPGWVVKLSGSQEAAEVIAVSETHVTIRRPNPNGKTRMTHKIKWQNWLNRFEWRIR